MQHVTIGPSDLKVSPIGVGAWAWGDRRYWGFGGDYGMDEVQGAFDAVVSAGVNFVDTAEIYGKGVSETIVGGLVARHGQPVVVATKFAPLPLRLSARSLRTALDASLARLGVERIDLYQAHWPWTLIRLRPLMDAMADAVESGKVRYVGVSNYGADKLRRAHEALARRGVPLVSNQMQYHLLNRTVESKGILDACREVGATLIAHSPLAQGILTGKYHAGNKVQGPRRLLAKFRPGALQRAVPVIGLLTEIGQAHGGTATQAALNWLARQEGVVPIPGVKDRRQAEDVAGALAWRMTDDETAAVDRATLAWR
jgi:aryl-alcohol dehydrogenase-like predicted oxidoreductase